MARETTSALGRGDPSVIARVEEIFRAAGRRIRTHLVNRGGADVQVRMGAVEIGSLDPFMERFRLKEGAIYARLKLSPGEIPGLMVMEGQLLQHLVSLMLGDMSASPGPQGFRSPTAIDLRIARRVLSDALDGVVELCPPLVAAKGKIDTLSTNPGMTLPFSRGSLVVEASLDFGPPDRPYGLLAFLFPSELINLWWPVRSNRTEGGEQGLRDGIHRIMPVPVNLVAELARIKLSLSEIRSLRPGALIDVGLTKDTLMRIGDRVAFIGEPGEQNGVRSVRIRSRVDISPKLKSNNSP